MGITRRQFVVGSIAAGTVLLGGPGRRVLGASEEIGVGIVGLGGQGSSHLGSYLGKEFQNMNVRLMAVCDADKEHTDKAVASAERAGLKVAGVQDLRRILDMKDVDAVVTATPNHWHSLLSIWAVQAGKDIYVEKPMSHDIFEGRKVVEAAAKYNRIVYVGTQNRSDEGRRAAYEWIWAGNIGKIVRGRGFCYKPRGSIGKTEGPQPLPPGLDYDLWCGPAPKDPLRRKKLHYDWHWFWATGNADIGNQGIHEMDKARWGIRATQVKRAMGFGGRYGYDDDAQTPNTETVFLETDTVPIIFEVRGLPMRKASAQENSPPMDAYKGVRIGEIIECEGGYYDGGWVYDTKGEKIKQFPRDSGKNHRANFIKCLRSRKAQDNPAPPIDGHRSAVCFHVGNISYRLGKEMKQAELAEMFKTDKVAQDCWERFRQHVGANEDAAAKWQPTVGPWLTFDPQAEKFTGAFADKANVLAKGPANGVYRAPYVVPEQV
ncbi:MAG: Gfo/Idh/MocA family oxidoreductase [Planctomycetes bacterium]|nr:Gfo/Idh/MocA family oxidoreductase [Planctomycetota bacterium]